MMHFKDHDYGSLYDRVIEERISEFMYTVQLPEVQFLTLNMESAFSELKAAIAAYMTACRNRIWWEGDGSAGIPQEWCNGEEKSEKRFWEAVEVMNRVSTDVWTAYCDFITEARRILKVEI